MSGKEKPGVTRRLNRGRSAPDTKCKTDSGCFVDEELERNGSASSDSSQGSINSSPVTELDSQRTKVINKKRKDNITASVASCSEPTVENEANRTSVCMQNVMSKEGAVNDEIECAHTHDEDRGGNVVEKTRRASDFYCLYYSASPENTLTRCGVSKVRSKPPVPPKPKLRRGSAPPSSFEKIERIQQQNKDITKRFSYNECQNASVRPECTEVDNFPDCDKWKSVEEHVLFFEACVKDGLTERNDLLKNVQAKSLKNSSDEACVGNTEVNVEIHNGFHCFDADQSSTEDVAPIVDTERFSLENNNVCKSVIFNGDVQEQIPPLVEEEEFTVDGSILSQSSINGEPLNSNCHHSKIQRDCLDSVREIDEVDYADHVVVDENQEGVSSSFDETERQYSDPLGPSETDVYTNGIVSNIHNGFEFVDASEARGSHLPDHSKTHCGDIRQLSCSSRTVPSLETTSGIDFNEILVNPRLSEIKQSSLPGFRQQDRNIRQRRPGSISGIPNLERDLSSEMKRRSWSFSETHLSAVNSPLDYNVHQAHTPRLRTTWQSENGLSSPSGSLFHQKRLMQSSINTINVSQEKIGWSSPKRTGMSHFDQSGYTSDDSSVHSEPLFQPQRRRPQSLAHGYIFKSMSCDSSISDMDKRRSSFPESEQKRFRHSLGSRDPVFALRRQSFEFSEDPPPFQQIRAPRLQNLRRTSSNASSSSDSEVERIFSEPSAPRYCRSTKTSVHNGFASSKPIRKVSAVEALFGPRSTSPLVKNVTPSSDLEEMGPTSITDKYSLNSSLPLAEDFLPEELEGEMAAITDPKEIEEPRLEFDDTDYSEFYTRCEDKDSIISAEALSIKKLLESPQTVLPDPDIESVVLSVTEKKTFSPSSDDKQNRGCQEELNDSDMDDDEQAISEDKNSSRQFYRWHRGTQTPPADVFRALSPSPSVGTQTPPLSVSQELLPPSLLKELQKDLQSSVPSTGSKTVSPTSSQELVDQLSLLGNVQAAPYTPVAFADTDRTSCQGNGKAVSVEELLQILATMKVGSTEEVPKRRPVSVQRYNHSPTPPLNAKSSRPNTISLPSSWHHLNSPVQRQNGSQDLKRPRGVPPRSSKSFDCLRQGVHSKDKTSGVTQAEAVRGSTSNEDIRKKLKEWTSTRKSQLFEEEVECLEGKHNPTKANEEKTLKVSYDGSEATDNIETLSRLTKTHSLKRPRRDRAFSQREKNGLEVNSLDEKRHFSLPTPKAKPCDEEGKGDVKLEDPITSSATEDSKFKDILFDSLDAEEIVTEGQLQEIASPEGVDVFIDYRKKNGLHITSTPKPPPYPGDSLVCREDGVGKNNTNNTDMPHNEKPASVKGAEDVPTDVESQGDASSSSYSSDDDHFGEFGGSTDTVVFVDTEASTGISLVSDLDTMDLKLVGNDNLLSVDNNDDDDEQDEASLDALLGEVRRSLNLEVVDSDILDKAIERFKQRVSPSSQDKALSGGLSMEACVALHQADELQGIISEIKGELKLLHEENDMLREQVSTLANHQTNGEVSENSSTESSERLENLYKLYRPKHVNSDDDEGDAVEVDVCLRGFSTVTLGRLPSKKEDIHLGTVTVKGADWNGVMEAARRIFVDHVNKIDPDGYLCLGAHSIQGVQTGVMLWSPDSLRKSSPRVELSKKSNPCIIQLKDGSHFSCDSLVYDTLLPKETIEKYVEDLLEHRHIVLCGQQSLGKSYLAAKLAEHIVQRVGWKCSPAVVTFNVSQSTRKELKQSLASFMQSDISSPQEGSPAVIVLEQLNCLATLASIFDLSILDNKNCPYIIGVRDKSRRGPFSSKELNLCHHFRWLRVSVNDRQYSGLLGRFLRRKLSWAQIQTDVEGSGRDLLDLFDWLSKVWYHLNEILEEYCEPESTIGPSLFFSCPMDYKAAEGWFVNVWNYNVIPYLHQALRSGRKIFDRSITWEDPTKWVILRYPWNKDHSRFLHTLRKLRQVDVVLNRNHLGSDNVCFAECIEENEKILRAHSTVSKRVRTVVQQKVPKGELTTRRNAAEQKRLLGNEEDKDSCYSETDSYLETSI